MRDQNAIDDAETVYHTESAENDKPDLLHEAALRGSPVLLVDCPVCERASVAVRLKGDELVTFVSQCHCAASGALNMDSYRALLTTRAVSERRYLAQVDWDFEAELRQA